MHGLFLPYGKLRFPYDLPSGRMRFVQFFSQKYYGIAGRFAKNGLQRIVSGMENSGILKKPPMPIDAFCFKMRHRRNVC